MLQKLKKDLHSYANKEQAINLSRFFKTGKGEYGEGDKFLGIMVPEQRKIAKQYKDLPLLQTTKLLQSPFHEERLTALFILTTQFEKGNDAIKEKIFKTYLKNTKHINNWDLIDLSAPKILGTHLLNKDRKILHTLSKSKDLWEKRIAMLSTFMFIKHNQFEDTLKIAETLLHDNHDLIHKAVGWALREIGNKDQAVEEKFLKLHYKTMPRTALRYAIEKFSDAKRKFYMGK